jgi:nitronate monooxygenase
LDRDPFFPRLGITSPVIQAPLAGGGDTPELVAAVAGANALGFVGAAYLAPAQIREAAGRVRSLTDRPFGINLCAPLPPAISPAPERAMAALTPYYRELGLPPPTAPSPPAFSFDQQLAACLESGAAVFSFTFGLLESAAVSAVKTRGMFLIGTATTVAEAVALEALGVDAVVAQGAEAGGHRVSFLADAEASLVGTMALVPQVVDAVRIPVIASGGIMDGRGVAAALCLGAQAVQMGTAFLTCHESGIPAVYKDAILAAAESGTGLTRAFSGRPARGIENRVMREVPVDAILPFPLQNALTRPLRTAAGKAGRPEFLSLWAGQGVRLARRQSAAELLARIEAELPGLLGPGSARR